MKNGHNHKQTNIMSVKFKITTKTFIPVFGIAKNIQTANTWRIECLRAISVWIQKKKTKRIEKIAKHEWPSHLICCSNQLKPNQSKRKFFISNWFSLCINFDFISIPLSISLSLSSSSVFLLHLHVIRIVCADQNKHNISRIYVSKWI